MAKKPKILVDEIRHAHRVKVWREKREIVVQVWRSWKGDGEADGDWAMPGFLGLDAAIAQAVQNTEFDIANKEKTK